MSGAGEAQRWGCETAGPELTWIGLATERQHRPHLGKPLLPKDAPRRQQLQEVPRAGGGFDRRRVVGVRGLGAQAFRDARDGSWDKHFDGADHRLSRTCRTTG